MKPQAWLFEVSGIAARRELGGFMARRVLRKCMSGRKLERG
jgi:hypothetical protein